MSKASILDQILPCTERARLIVVANAKQKELAAMVCVFSTGTP